MGDGPKTDEGVVMSDTTDTAQAGEHNTEGEPNGFEPIASQEALDKIIQARVARERAKFQDYDDLKAKAEKYDETASELAALKERDQLNEWKTQVSKDTGVPIDVLRGSTLDELKAHGESLKTLMAARPVAPVVPDAGKQPDHKTSSGATFMRELFGND